MNRRNAMLITISICTLSAFTFICIYYGSQTKSMPLETNKPLIITATNPSAETDLTKKEISESKLDKKLATTLEKHFELMIENNDLILELKMINSSNSIGKTYFVSELNEKSFKNTKEKIAFIKKEIGQLKKENNLIRKNINNVQKKK